jgi:hypothetical protein
MTNVQMTHTHLLQGQEVTNSVPYTAVFLPPCHIYVFLQRIVLFAVRVCRYAWLRFLSIVCMILPIHRLLIERTCRDMNQIQITASW